MGNITAERSDTRYGASTAVIPAVISLPMSASLKVWKGGLVAASNAAATKGQAVKAGAAMSQQVVGVAVQTVDNSSGAAGALSVDVRQGAFWFANSASSDQIDLHHIGMPAYVVDDQTVALTDSAGSRVIAGTVVNVDSNLGVLVMVGVGVSQNEGQHTISLAMDLSSAANATLYTFTPQYNGKIKKITASVNKAAAGAGATVTITPNIAAAPLTGGVLTPTLGNCTLGAELTATGITGANYFTAGQAITLVGSSFTAFTAGNITIVLHIG
jgi:hypothetical protein